MIEENKIMNEIPIYTIVQIEAEKFMEMNYLCRNYR